MCVCVCARTDLSIAGLHSLNDDSFLGVNLWWALMLGLRAGLCKEKKQKQTTQNPFSQETKDIDQDLTTWWQAVHFGMTVISLWSVNNCHLKSQTVAIVHHRRT